MDQKSAVDERLGAAGLGSLRAKEMLVPVWFDELNSGLSIRPHFAISGNLRDLYPLDDGTEV